MIMLTYPTTLAEFQKQLAVSTIIDGLRGSEITQTLRLTELKNISEALGSSRQIRLHTREQLGVQKKVKAFVKRLQNLLNNFHKRQDPMNMFH